MLAHISPALFALLVMIAVLAIVTALIRRHDRVRPPWSERGVPAGALFVVHGRLWTHVMIRVFGIVFVVVGGLMFLSGFTVIGNPDSIGMFIAGFCIAFIGGVGFLLLTVGMKRRCTEAYDGHLLVVPMFRAVLTVRPDDIKRFSPSMNRMGGIDIKLHDRFSVVPVIAIDVRYPDLCAWLARSAPAQWNEFVRVHGN